MYVWTSSTPKWRRAALPFHINRSCRPAMYAVAVPATRSCCGPLSVSSVISSPTLVCVRLASTEPSTTSPAARRLRTSTGSPSCKANGKLLGSVKSRTQDRHRLFVRLGIVHPHRSIDHAEHAVDVGHAVDGPQLAAQRFRHGRHLAGGQVGGHGTNDEVALERLGLPSANVLDAVEDGRSQADGRADGDVEQSDGQRGAHAAAKDLPLGDAPFDAEDRDTEPSRPTRPAHPARWAPRARKRR